MKGYVFRNIYDSLKRTPHLRNVRGEISASLAVLSVVLMAIGVVIGSQLVLRGPATSTQTSAQTASGITPNAENPHITATFESITNHNATTPQKRINSKICFKPDSALPPTSGRYRINAVAILKETGASVNIGSSLDKILGSDPAASQCTNTQDLAIFTYANVDDVPQGITHADIEKIEFHLSAEAGSWDPIPVSLVGTMTDISPIFGAAPASPTPTGPQACQQIQGKVDANIIAQALANPGGIEGWNELQNPSQPESATNPRKKFLTLKNIALPFHPVSNSVVFKVACENPPAQPGTITANVKLDNTSFAGIFNGFEYRVETCTFADSNNNGQYDPGLNEVIGCGTALGNKQGRVQQVESRGAGELFTSESTDTLENMPGGKRVLSFSYGLYADFGRDTARKETTGVMITTSAGTCTPISRIGGTQYCMMTVDGNKTVDFTVKLPDINVLSFRSGFISDGGSPLADCLFTSDSTAEVNRSGRPCSIRTSRTSNNIIIDFKNTSGTARKVKWALTRCYGTLANNGNTCLPNPGQGTDLDLQNHFEETEGVQVPNGQTRRCIVNINNYPIDDESYENILAAVSCTIVTPTSTATPTPGPNDDENAYYANVAIYNSGQSKIIKVLSHACENGVICVDGEVDTDIAPGVRENVSIKLGNITSNTRFFTLTIEVEREGASAGVRFNQELNVTKPQNVFYNLEVKQDSIEGTGKTEFDAADLASNNCVNAEDASRVIAKLAEFTDPQQCLPEDINCDGIVNTLDLSIIISNLAACSE